jgi:hypothetical protein
MTLMAVMHETLSRVRVSNARVDAFAGAASVCVAGIAGLVAASWSGSLPMVWAILAFIVGAPLGATRAIRRWRDEKDEDERFVPLPAAAAIRPRWLAPAWVMLDTLLITAASIAACVWSQWAVIGAGGLAGLSARPLVDWLALRRWEHEHDATVYYERMPLMTGGVSARYFMSHAQAKL